MLSIMLLWNSRKVPAPPRAASSMRERIFFFRSDSSEAGVSKARRPSHGSLASCVGVGSDFSSTCGGFSVLTPVGRSGFVPAGFCGRSADSGGLGRLGVGGGVRSSPPGCSPDVVVPPPSPVGAGVPVDCVPVGRGPSPPPTVVAPPPLEVPPGAGGVGLVPVGSGPSPPGTSCPPRPPEP